MFKKYFFSSVSLEEGQALKEHLGTLIHRPGQMDLKSAEHHLPQYKVFTGLVQDALGLVRFYGLSPKGIFGELRHILQEDLKRERRLQKKRRESYGQMFLMGLFIWPFVFLTQYVLEVQVEFFFLGVMLVMQALGLILFIVVLGKGELVIFKGVTELTHSLYTLRGLVTCGVARARCLQQAKIEETLRLDLASHWDTLREGLAQTLSQWSEGGYSPGENLRELCDEMWFVYEERMDLYDKYSYSVRLAVLAGFFLPTLFVFMYALFTVMIGQDILLSF
jgi:hypothetical protein